MRNKTIVIVSGYVDNTINELQPDVQSYIFKSITELEEYITQLPIRADTLYISKDVLKPTVNVALSAMDAVLRNHFFVVNTVEYITSLDDLNTSAVLYMNDKFPIAWKINKGSLSRDYIYSLISGTLAQEEITAQTMVRVRTKRADYVRSQIDNSENPLMNEPFESEEDKLSDIPSVEVETLDMPRASANTTIISLYGKAQRELRIFTYLSAQYLSLKGKVIFIEPDFEFLELSDYVARSGLEPLIFNIEDLYNNPSDVLFTIQNTRRKLIFFGAKMKSNYSYNFVSQILYNNLNGYIDYIIQEGSLDDIVKERPHVIILPDNISQIIATLHKLNIPITDNTSFAVVNTCSVSEITSYSKGALCEVIKDIMQAKNPIQLVSLRVNSLTLGGEVNDLQVLFRTK